jgi:hypothetical protein
LIVNVGFSRHGFLAVDAVELKIAVVDLLGGVPASVHALESSLGEKYSHKHRTERPGPRHGCRFPALLGSMPTAVIGLDQPDATFAAATLAALASLLSLVITVRAAIRAERRAAQRTLVKDTVEELSSALHENVASATTLLKRAKKTEGRKNNLARCEIASERLKALRPRVRIALGDDVDEALKTLSRVPNWAANYDDHTAGSEFLKRSDKLRRALDAAIGRAYLRGRRPRRWERWWVANRSDRVQHVWKKDFPQRE